MSRGRSPPARRFSSTGQSDDEARRHSGSKLPRSPQLRPPRERDVARKPLLGEPQTVRQTTLDSTRRPPISSQSRGALLRLTRTVPRHETVQDRHSDNSPTNSSATRYTSRTRTRSHSQRRRSGLRELTTVNSPEDGEMHLADLSSPASRPRKSRWLASTEVKRSSYDASSSRATARPSELEASDSTVRPSARRISIPRRVRDPSLFSTRARRTDVAPSGDALCSPEEPYPGYPLVDQSGFPSTGQTNSYAQPPVSTHAYPGTNSSVPPSYYSYGTTPGSCGTCSCLEFC